MLFVSPLGYATHWQDFREKEASVIDIPNIGYDTFTAMMRYIYVGTVEVEQEQALPLLQVSHQYTGPCVVHLVLQPLDVAIWLCCFSRCCGCKKSRHVADVQLPSVHVHSAVSA